jgi:hypothetical protein
MYQKLVGWIQKYERHLSALAMIAGFVCDNLFFTRIDIERTQILLAIYAAACFIAIPALHFIEARIARGKPRPRGRFILPFITQFALGGFWSAFVIFYSRSAVFSASWPFLLFIFLIFLGSEYFHTYHERLVFTSVLFFFALYSSAIFEVPIYTGTIGTLTFLESGLVAICIFILFTVLLRILGRERFLGDVKKIRIGALGVLVVINLFYFTNILPPLPLSAIDAGIYHSVWRVPGEYMATSEAEPWQTNYFGLAPTIHIVSGDSVYAYSSVFAPTTLTTTIVHRWQWYDPTKKEWVTETIIAYSIIGGRDGGYRGYSDMPINMAGQWRVNIETSDGLLIAHLPFTVEIGKAEPPEATTTLQ